jgi:hypothetical protein
MAVGRADGRADEREITMKRIALCAGLSLWRRSATPRVPTVSNRRTNVWGAEYPRVDATGQVQLRIKAPEATKVKLNFWSGPKVDMQKQSDGFWTFTTEPWSPDSTTTCSTWTASTSAMPAAGPTSAARDT